MNLDVVERGNRDHTSSIFHIHQDKHVAEIVETRSL